MAALSPVTDGVVTIRATGPGDATRLVAGRDEVFRRFLGEGDPEPNPVGVIEVAGEVVGWVDHDRDRAWLEPGEVNVGYHVIAPHRGRGYASRGVQLLLHHLALTGAASTVTLLIHPDNERSLALARRLRFAPAGEVQGDRYFKRAVPPLTYGDGTVSLRRRTPFDLDLHLAGIDDEQIDWLWLPGHRASWEAMSPVEQRAHGRRYLAEDHAAFGRGPKWTFALDAPAATYVAYLDCDLANEHVRRGEANVSYTSRPGHRGRGHVSRGVRLVLGFLRDHTSAREAHLLVDVRNEPSLRVARAVGAVETERWIDGQGHEMVRHVISIERP